MGGGGPTGGRGLEFHVPGLFGPYPAQHKPPGVDAPGLEQLLRFAVLQPGRGDDPLRQRLVGFIDEGAYSGGGTVAVAALERLAGGRSAGGTDEGVWMRCDPVILRADRDRLLMFDAVEANLQADEAEGILDTLNATYADDGWYFDAYRADVWHLRLPRSPRALFVEPFHAVGRPVESFLPSGEDGRFWLTRLNEMQMLLHDHPVNRAREGRGLPAINALWPWGAGTLPTLRRPHWDVIWDDDPTGTALAEGVGIESRPVPADASAWLATAGSGNHRVFVDTLRRCLEYGDFSEWLELLPRFDRDWFQPLVAALDNRSLDTLTLIDGLWYVRVAPPNRFAFWRRLRRSPGVMDLVVIEDTSRRKDLS
ncbi:MAG: hypothetical protein ACPGU7_00830 [Gammaproteobacteria bacterium]